MSIARNNHFVAATKILFIAAANRVKKANDGFMVTPSSDVPEFLEALDKFEAESRKNIKIIVK